MTFPDPDKITRLILWRDKPYTATYSYGFDFYNGFSFPLTFRTQKEARDFFHPFVVANPKIEVWIEREAYFQKVNVT